MGMAKSLPKLVYHNTVTIEYSGTSIKPFELQLPIISNYNIAVFIDTIPVPPDTGYIALSSGISRVSGVPQSYGQILRANGTIGTDPNQVKYSPDTGMLKLGGDYGTFVEGMTYHIYAFEIG